MRISIKVLGSVLFLIIAGLVSHSCKKESTLPSLTTAEPSDITQKTVTSGGAVTSGGSEDIVVAGICWSTTTVTSVKDKHTNDSMEVGSFTSNLTGLTPDTKYYIKAYAYTKAGVGYGNEVTFTTSPIALSTVTTTDVASVTATSATSGGNITSDGGASVTSRGICWSTNPNPTLEGTNTADGTGTGSFTSNMKCLTDATTYYVRAYATNSAGTAYGDQQIFATEISTIIFNSDVTYGSVLDIDDNCYKTIQIGDQIWMAENLRTSRYNDGTSIPNVTDNAEWANLGDP
jgi:hypothetical protein